MPPPVTFFDHQALAKRKSRRALLGFMVVIILTCTVGGLSGGILGWLFHDKLSGLTRAESYWISVRIFSSFWLVVILTCWLVRRRNHIAEPEQLMQLFEARQLIPDSEVFTERKLLNCVEEMAVASGIPVPDVYLIDSPAINACSAGNHLHHTVIAVTRGATEKLTRDELQGMVAHEFSHLLYGDSLLQRRLMNWLTGLYIISAFGKKFIHAFDSSKGDWFSGIPNSLPHPLTFIPGSLIWLLGSTGLFFGKLFQSLFCRNRILLADATAVQLTRNPEGLSHTLLKLGKSAGKAKLPLLPNEVAHLMFATVTPFWCPRFLSTHPSQHARIRQLLPDWDGNFPAPVNPNESASDVHSQPSEKPTQALPHFLDAPPVNLDPELLSQCRNPEDAQLFIYAVLISAEDGSPPQNPDLQISSEQQDRLQKLTTSAWLHAQDPIQVVDLCLPALRQLDPASLDKFLRNVDTLCEADGFIHFFEFCLQRILAACLCPPPKQAPLNAGSRKSLLRLQPEISLLLSILSRLGSDDPEEIAHAFHNAVKRLQQVTPKIRPELLPTYACSLEELGLAFDRLSSLYPRQQELLLEAAKDAIEADKKFTPDELQLFRALCAVFQIPVPPGLGM